MFKLLVVDDETLIRQGILHSIDWDRLNIQAFEASNGLMAYDMILKDKYDIILLDIKMPGLTGLELIEKVRNSNIDKDIAFIILSGYAEFSLANQAMKYGVKYYLLKPTDEEEIVSTLEKVIAEMKVQNTSHDKMVPLFNKISSHVRNGNGVSAKEELENFLQVLKECNVKETCLNYFDELLLLIIRQCKDFQLTPKLLNMSSQVNIDSSLDEMFNLTLKAITEVISINQAIEVPKYSKSIQSTLDYIYENISNDELSLSYLSSHLYMNADYVGKLFKKEVKESFTDYLSRVRVEKAQELIQINPNEKICDIAEKVGFGCNSQYFSQIFKKYTGYTPKDYKTLFVK